MSSLLFSFHFAFFGLGSGSFSGSRKINWFSLPVKNYQNSKNLSDQEEAEFGDFDFFAEVEDFNQVAFSPMIKLSNDRKREKTGFCRF
jgi:hypothetical protein